MMLRRLLEWLDRNYRRLLVVGLFMNAIAYLMLTFYYAFCLETMEAVAREEVRKWLEAHNITVVVQHVQERTIEISETVFALMIATIFFLGLVVAMRR